MNDITLRDWLAGQALIGLATMDNLRVCSYEYLSKAAYKLADAMMAERVNSL